MGTALNTVFMTAHGNGFTKALLQDSHCRHAAHARVQPMNPGTHLHTCLKASIRMRVPNESHM